MAKKDKSKIMVESRPTPSPFDSEICWQCHYINPPELGYDMLPESGGYCVCKGWTEDVFGEACELFRRKYGASAGDEIDPLTKEDWDQLNNM